MHTLLVILAILGILVIGIGIGALLVHLAIMSAFRNIW